MKFLQCSLAALVALRSLTLAFVFFYLLVIKSDRELVWGM
jgi:hypothetical protein